jgi:hypothetical protein
MKAFIVSLLINWQEVAQKVKILTEKLDQGELGALSEIRNVLLNLTAPTYLVSESLCSIILLATAHLYFKFMNDYHIDFISR